MIAIRLRASLAAAAFACLFTSFAMAQTPAKPPAKAPARPAVATGPWAKVPPLTTLCYQYTGEVADPFYAKLDAAKSAVSADLEKQNVINAKVAEEFQNIDPMEKAQRMQQWMMSNPQEAMAMAQAAQQAGAAAAQASTDLQTAVQQQEAKKAPWNALVKSYEDARIAAYAPLEPRRKALYSQLGYEYSTARKDLLQPKVGFGEDWGNTISQAAYLEGEALNAGYDRAYESICPQWWGANGKFQAYLKQEKDRLLNERVPELEKSDAAKLQQYAIMSSPTASYQSTAKLQAVGEYLELLSKVYGERDAYARCRSPRECDGAYP
jgi:hypothetical protein